MPIITVDQGTKLGPYETLEPLGAGGMGEVYKARDTRLNRTVAIKVLPSALAAHPELRQRLEREARAVSSLNHPHICTLYDIGHQDGIDFLVLEYLEGETLAQRLKKGALPLDTGLRYAIEIAGALDQAHRHGIVHRDLKPGNVMLTRSGAKLLDFGLAKFREAAKAPVDDATVPLTRDLTSEGTLIGTIQYMAPEQLEGKEADARTDIFAFGAVLYEMITGQKAFHGASQASLIAEILTADPAPLSSVQPLTPATLDRVVKSCLAKDPEDRWQSAGDLARELKWMADPAVQSESGKLRPRPPDSRAAIPWIVAAAAVLGLAAVSWFHFREPAPGQQPSIRFTIPTEAVLPSQVRISPDGTRVAFVGLNAQGSKVLWIRPLDQLAAQALPGTEGAMYPFWAPDSRQLAFFDPQRQKLKKIDSSGGQPQIVCDAPYGLGGDWGRDGTILFSPDGNGNSAIYRVTSNGGVPAPVGKPGASSAAARFPWFLPDGKHFFYLNRFGKFTPVGGETDSIRVASLQSKETKPLVETDYSAAFWPGLKSRDIPPYLLFVRNGALLAQEMDPTNFQLRGESSRILDSLATDGIYNFADFSVSENGTLAFNSAVYQHEVVWLDRSGKRLGAGVPADRYAHPAITPDGKQAVFEMLDPKTAGADLWKLDVDRGEVALLKKGGLGPQVMFPDGGSVAFPCMMNGKPEFCKKAIGGAKREEVFWEFGEASAPIDISPDGRFLSYSKIESLGELWILPLQGDRKPYRFDPSESFQFHGLFSSDGKRIAYTSNETGDFEVYVQPFPATGEKWKISSHGGGQPRWGRDGKELFYRTVDGKMMVVPLKTGPAFEAGVPRMLFQTSADPLFPNLGIPYAVTADSQRFLVNVARDESRASPITIITNWQNGLKR
jgi:serine/threonine protein kinase